VEIGGDPAKPARNVHAGEIVTVRVGEMTRTLRVIDAPRSRVGAKLVANFCTELTPAAEFERVRQNNLQRVLARPRGTGRPTKKDRRVIDQFFS
jgi:ribosome-associated heat shock protein Hsp15